MASLLDNIRTSGRSGRPTGKGSGSRSKIKKGSRCKVADQKGLRRL